jgi:hypothetical protein
MTESKQLQTRLSKILCRVCGKVLPYKASGRGRGRPRIVHERCAARNNRRRAAEWYAAHRAQSLPSDAPAG